MTGFRSLAAGAVCVALSACGGGGSQVQAPPFSAVATAAPEPGYSASGAATSAGAACIVTLGSTTYAFFGSGAGLMEVALASGSTIVSERGSARGAGRRRAASSAPAVLALDQTPQECAADLANDDLYLANTTTPEINVVHVDPASHAMTLLASYVTDATSSIKEAGGSATIPGIVFDPADAGLIIATKTGYELWAGARTPMANTLLDDIAAVPPSENFGYDALTDDIWSPTYLPQGSYRSSARLINVPSGAAYLMAPAFSGLLQPGGGAIDTTTGIATASEEFSPTLYLASLGAASFDGANSTFSDSDSAAIAIATTIQSVSGDNSPMAELAIDPASHLEFSAAEAGHTIGVQTLPASGSASGAPALGPVVFATLPNADLTGTIPHTAATFHAGSSGPYGFVINATPSLIYVVDLKKLLAAPRSAADPTIVSSSYDLVANGVISEIPI